MKKDIWLLQSLSKRFLALSLTRKFVCTSEEVYIYISIALNWISKCNQPTLYQSTPLKHNKGLLLSFFTHNPSLYRISFAYIRSLLNYLAYVTNMVNYAKVELLQKNSQIELNVWKHLLSFQRRFFFLLFEIFLLASLFYITLVHQIICCLSVINSGSNRNCVFVLQLWTNALSLP